MIQKLMSDEKTGTAISSSPPYGKDRNLKIMAGLLAGNQGTSFSNQGQRIQTPKDFMSKNERSPVVPKLKLNEILV